MRSPKLVPQGGVPKWCSPRYGHEFCVPQVGSRSSRPPIGVPQIRPQWGVPNLRSLYGVPQRVSKCVFLKGKPRRRVPQLKCPNGVPQLGPLKGNTPWDILQMWSAIWVPIKGPIGVSKGEFPMGRHRRVLSWRYPQGVFPPCAVPHGVCQGGTHGCSTSREPQTGFLVGFLRVVTQRLPHGCSSMGSPKGLSQGGFPRVVPQWGSPKRGPPNRVPQKWSTNGSHRRGLPQRGYPKVVPQIGVPQMVYYKGRIPSGVTQWWSNRGVPMGSLQRVFPRGVPKGGFPNLNTPRGARSVRIYGHNKVFPPTGITQMWSFQGSRNRGPPREFPQRRSSNGGPQGGPPYRLTQGVLAGGPPPGVPMGAYPVAVH